MRNLFLILLLANLVYFGWQYTHTPAREPGVTLVNPNRAGPEIPLAGGAEDGDGEGGESATSPDAEGGSDADDAGDVGEPPGAATAAGASGAPETAAAGTTQSADAGNTGAVPAAGRRGATSPEAPPGEGAGSTGDEDIVAAAAAAPGVPATCLSIGPFQDGEAAAAAFAAAEARGLNAGRRTLQDDVFAGHWVQVTNIANRAQANALIEKLKAAGLSDAYLLRGEPGNSAISLGLFSDISGAERMGEQASDAGIEAVIQETYRERTVHWVDAAGARARDASALAERFGADKVIVGDAARCPGAA